MGQLHCHLETTGDYIKVSQAKSPYYTRQNPNTAATIDLCICPTCSPSKIQFTKEGKETAVWKASYSWKMQMHSKLRWFGKGTDPEVLFPIRLDESEPQTANPPVAIGSNAIIKNFQQPMQMPHQKLLAIARQNKKHRPRSCAPTDLLPTSQSPLDMESSMLQVLQQSCFLIQPTPMLLKMAGYVTT